MSGRRANVIGTGLIGASIGLALRERGWVVSGVDDDHAAAAAARDAGAIDEVGLDERAVITFVATPVGSIASEVARALDATSGVVTDVGSVKARITELVDDPRFVVGHPMAGSEQDGVAGAYGEMFVGAMWVLSPTATTADTTFSTVANVVTELGADVVTLAPDAHDQLVATVSHVPHLTAGTLMRLASARNDEHSVLLRLAAGGFRDMTRVAAGAPGIWPDICIANKDAILEVLGDLTASLQSVRELVADEDRHGLLEWLSGARAMRRNLPSSAPRPSQLSELRVPMPDRPGEIAAIASLATSLDVNIYSIDIAHSAEGPRGVLIALVDRVAGPRLADGLVERGYHPSLVDLEDG